MSRMVLIAVVVILPQAARICGEEISLPDRAEMLQQLRPRHPRLMATRESFQDLAKQCATEERAGQWLANLRARAEQLLAAPPVKYEIPDGKRLLAVSREAKQRMLLLGLVHQLSGERKFADRAWTELTAVVQFQDWNPSHFLDTAEMTFAVAIGYDWMYDAWNEDQRKQLRAAIVRLGLQPGLAVYRGKGWWAKVNHNWNQVCNGGMAVGALAIADVEPELAGEVLHAALQSLPLAMREFAPDGGWGEGPSYWHYATEYNVYLLAALQSALGTDYGLGDIAGFSQTGHFPLHVVGPRGKSFNFGDAHDGWHGASQWFWLADRFDHPAWAEAQLPYADARPSPLDLLWGAPWAARRESPAPLPLAQRFDHVSVIAMRSAWNDEQATFVAFKGGDNRVNHGHLDLGSFVFDALGERWAVDLGPDDYNLPGYFGRQRWTYFRNNTQSHNALVISGENQSPAASAKIIRFAAGEAWTGGVVDLTAAWPQVTRAGRGVAMIDKGRVLVQDELSAPSPVAATWQMLTPATIAIDGQTAVLTQNKRTITATLLSPADARWSTEEVVVTRPEKPAVNIRKLIATTEKPQQELRYAIVLDPSRDADGKKIDLVPLPQWPTTAE